MRVASREARTVPVRRRRRVEQNLQDFVDICERGSGIPEPDHITTTDIANLSSDRFV
jgi:hypothetical protein